MAFRPGEELGLSDVAAVARNLTVMGHEQGVAFAAVRCDGTVQTWGCKEDGGDCRAVRLGLHSPFGSTP